MFGDHDQLELLAEQLFHCILTPEMLPDMADSLVAWLGRPLDAGSCDCEAGGHTPLNGIPISHGRSKRGLGRNRHQPAARPAAAENSFAMSALLDADWPNWRRIVDLFIHCRELREFSNSAVNWAHSSHVAAIILTKNGRVLDCDCRGSSFVKAGNVLRLVDGRLCCSDGTVQARFNLALKETAEAGRTTNVLLHAPEAPGKRFSLTFAKMQRRLFAANDGSSKVPNVLCLVAPLDGRRIATAQQLMDLFGLSAAEARLARAICHGDSVAEYARDQGLRVPTIRTQLSSIFAKTGCERQARLVRLIAGIPVVRDPAY